MKNKFYFFLAALCGMFMVTVQSVQAETTRYFDEKSGLWYNVVVADPKEDAEVTWESEDMSKNYQTLEEIEIPVIIADEIKLPHVVNKICDNAFSGSSVKSVSVKADKDGGTILAKIGNRSFYQCKNLQKIDMGNHLCVIGDEAFRGSGLKKVSIPDKVNMIRQGTFADCPNLDSVYLGKGVSSIADDAFSNSPKLADITCSENNATFTTMGGILFSRDKKSLKLCPPAKSGIVEIPAATEVIEPNAFKNCSQLTRINNQAMTPQKVYGKSFSGTDISKMTLHVPVGCKKAYSEADYWKDFAMIVEDLDAIVKIDKLYYQLDYKNRRASVTYETNHSSNYAYLTGTLTIPSSVTFNDVTYHVRTIAENAFSYSPVQEVIIEEGVSTIGGWAFYKCKHLKKISLPKSLQQIDQFAFRMSGIQSLVIPDNITDISYIAGGCDSLRTITLGAKVNDFVYAWKGCHQLEQINVSENNEKFTSLDGVLYSKNMDRLICCPEAKKGTLIVPNGVSTINAYAITDTRNITSIHLPYSLTHIDGRNFVRCNKAGFDDVLPIPLPPIYYEVTVEEPVISQDENCGTLTGYQPDFTLYVPKGCASKLTSFPWSEFNIIELDPKTLIDDNIKYSLDPITRTAKVIGYEDGLSGKVIIPDTVEDSNHDKYVVNQIGERAFKNANITEIFVGDNVTFMSDAFNDCPKLKKLTIGKGITYWYHINATGLEEIDVVDGNTEYTSVDGILYDKEMTTLVFCPAARTKEINFPSSVTTIGDYSFSNCQITSIMIPEGVTKMKYCCFSNCESLTSVTLPSSLVMIAENAFKQTNLKNLTVRSKTPLALSGKSVFGALNLSKINLWVPYGSESAYKSADVWKEFGAIATKTARIKAGEFYYIIDNDTKTATLTWDKYDSENNYSSVSGTRTVPVYASYNDIDYLVTAIADSAFYRARYIEEINIGKGVQTIGDFAFASCPKLHTIGMSDPDVMNPNLREIGRDAFNNSPLLANINNIPYSVTRIGQYAFNNTAIYKDEANWEDGVLYLYNCLIKAKPGKMTGSYTIKPGTRVITEGAFAGCSDLTEVTVPNSVTIIPSLAFASCSALEKVNLPSTLNVIGDFAFSGCTQVKAYDFGESLWKIGYGAFTNNKALTSICLNDFVSEIGKEAFRSCTNLKTVTNWNFDNPQPIAGKNVFAELDLSKMTLVVLPGKQNMFKDADVWKEFGKIEERFEMNNFTFELVGGQLTLTAYSGDTANLELPEPYQYGNNKLEKMIYKISSSLKSKTCAIGNEVFLGHSELKYLSFPMNSFYTSIGENAFEGCANLEVLILPESITEIKAAAFDGTGATVYVPNKAKVDPSAFEGAKRLNYTQLYNYDTEYAYFARVGTHWYMAQCKSPNRISVILPDNVKGESYRIGDGAFANMTVLETVMIPDTVDFIGERAFRGCSAFNKLALPAKVTTIGSQAFAGTALKSVTNNALVPQTITPDVFSGIDIAKVHLMVQPEAAGDYATAEVWKDFDLTQTHVEGDFRFAKVEDQWMLIGYTGNEENITLPEKVQGNSYDIADCAFMGNEQLLSVVIPEGIQHIGEYAFKDCRHLADISLPSTLTSIGERAFYHCFLDSLFLPDGIEHIETYTFRDARVNYVKLPANLKTIGYGAFFDCNMKKLIVPASVTTIGDYAFYDGQIQELELSESLKTIGYAAFGYNNSISPVVLPEGLTEVGAYAFYYGYTNLLTIPSTLEKIGKCAFYTGEVDIIVKDFRPQPQIITGSDKVFGYARLGNSTLYVVDEAAIDEYRKADVWRTFGSIRSIDKEPVIGDYVFVRTPDWKYKLVAYTGKGKAELVLPEQVDGHDYDIDDDVFRRNTDITKVTLPVGVKKIGNDAFKDCYNLEEINLENVKKIGNDAFNYCYNLEEINLENVEEIGEYAFISCYNLSKVRFGNALKSIGNAAFAYVPLIRVDIPEGMTTISEFAFFENQARCITLPSTLTFLGNRAFTDSNNGNLKMVISKNPTPPVCYTYERMFKDNLGDCILYVPVGCKSAYENAPVWEDFGTIIEGEPDMIGDYVFRQSANGSWSLFAYLGNDSEIKLPDDIYGSSYTIGKQVFYKNSKLTKVTLGEEVTGIGYMSFYDCPSLTELNLSEALYSINDYFDGTSFGSTPITTLTLPSANESFTLIDGVLFTANKQTLAYLPAGRTGTYDVPEGTKRLADFCGYYNNLQQINLPEGLEYIGWASTYSYTLEQLDIPSSVKEIKNMYFTQANKRLIFHSGELNLQNSRFILEEKGLTDIINYSPTPQPAIVKTFANYAYTSLKEITLHVPAGSKEAYEADEVWKQFTIVEDIFTVTFKDWDGTVLKTQTLIAGDDAVAPEDPSREFYHFVGWDKDFTGVTDNMEITAQYQAFTWHVTLLAENGSVSVLPEETDLAAVTHGTTLTLTATPDDGYEFVGWSDEAEGATRDFVVVSDTTLTASFALKKFTVTYYDWDLTLLGTEQVEKGKDAQGLNPEPTREGYTFTGWSKPLTNITSDLSVQAQYKENVEVDYTPQNLKAALLEQNNDVMITLSWDKVDGAASYELRVAIGENELFSQNTMTLNVISSLLSTIEKEYQLTPGTFTIDWFVRSTDGMGNPISDWAQGESFEVTIKDTGTGLYEVNSQKPTANSQKILIDGVLYIERNGHLFDAQGQMVK